MTAIASVRCASSSPSCSRTAKEGDGDELAVLRRERKRRREAEHAYRDAGRTDLADGEEYEAGVIEGYLPAELGDDELDALVAAAVADRRQPARATWAG